MVDFGHIVKYNCVFTQEAPDRLTPLPLSYPYPLPPPGAFGGDLRRGTAGTFGGGWGGEALLKNFPGKKKTGREIGSLLWNLSGE